MASLAGLAPQPALEPPHAQQDGGLLPGLAVLAVALGAWALELRRRAAAGAEAPNGRAGARLVRAAGLQPPGLQHALAQLAPEAACLVLWSLAVGALLLWGGNNGSPAPTPEDQQAWHEILAEWRVLKTADSLLAMQAGLRLLLLASAVLRSEESLASPLAGEPAALLCLAAGARTTLLALSPPGVYQLDGPLGGVMHIAAEVAAVGPLAFLALFGRKAARAFPALVAAPALLAGWLAVQNHLAIAGPQAAHLDMLFSFATLAELAGAVLFLGRTACAVADDPPAPFSTLAHLLLPLQQLLAAYFLLTAWGGAPLEEMPVLVGAGQPFTMLQVAAACGAGAYFVAGALRIGFSSEGEKGEGPLLLV